MASREQVDFSGAIATWKDIDLTELKQSLDTQGLEIVENQKENVVGRKKLAEQTREFKKIPEGEKSSAFKSLLKAYQAEIDNLTRRSKVAENCFLGVYKLLAEAPDPYPLLEAVVEQTAAAAEAASLSGQLEKARQENAELKRRNEELVTQQGDEKGRAKLQAKVDKYETKMEDMIKERVAAKENELNATYDERIRNLEERERDLQRQLALTKDQLRDLRTSNDTTQAKLLNQSQRQDQETLAKLAELDMVVMDLERANSRVADVERRNEILRAEIEAVRSGSEQEERTKALEAQVAELEAEGARLLRALDTQKAVAKKAADQANVRLDELAKDLAGKTGEVESLRQKLKQYSDYDEIKRELEIIKYVEFAGNDLDGNDDEDNVNEMRLPTPKGDQTQAKPLENLLMAKNRKLQDELTKLRNEHDDLVSESKARTNELESLRKQVTRLKVLNERLENDLVSINQPARSTSLDKGNRSSQDGAGAGAAKAENTDSLTGLKIGQKDTPPELRKQFEAISELRAEVKTLQADNLKLYEKVRYMQSYREEAAASGSSGATPRFTDSYPPQSTRRDEGLSKYRNAYEQSVNPFEVFRGREQSRAVASLNIFEKILHSLARLILGSRILRIAFIAYSILLHLVVVFSLYEAAPGDLGTVKPASRPDRGP